MIVYAAYRNIILDESIGDTYNFIHVGQRLFRVSLRSGMPPSGMMYLGMSWPAHRVPYTVVAPVSSVFSVEASKKQDSFLLLSALYIFTVRYAGGKKNHVGAATKKNSAYI